LLDGRINFAAHSLEGLEPTLPRGIARLVLCHARIRETRWCWHRTMLRTMGHSLCQCCR
jgi:hypothetical protein